jgi:hypothetical protein
VGNEYVVIMVVNEYLVYKVSLGYVALALEYLIALWVCSFTGSVKGKRRVRGFNTCVLLPCGYVALWAVLKVSLRYVALALEYLIALRICGFTGSVKGKFRVCGSST